MEKGIKGLTIKILAKEMGFSESAIYRHFESKEDIIVLLFNALGESFQKQFLLFYLLGNLSLLNFRQMY
jgi:AcrR family transcriptional regulator